MIYESRLTTGQANSAVNISPLVDDILCCLDWWCNGVMLSDQWPDGVVVRSLDCDFKLWL